MVDLQDIIRAVNEELADGNLFVVDVKMSPGDEIEVYIDSDGTGADGRTRGVSVEDCIRLSRAIENRFDRDEDDFSLTVSSAGIGQPLRTMRQYRKLVGRQVEVVLTGGAKFTATLEGVEAGAGDGTDGGSITLSYPEKQKIEGQKRPQTVTVTKTFPLSDVKTTKEYIDFK
jgi:ribosome maturation factor RimP